MKLPSLRLFATALTLAGAPLAHAQTQPLPVLQGTVNDVRTINTANLLAQMDHGSTNSDLVLVAAHRGYWLNAPENSNQALQAAFNSGVEIIEIDVRTTSDGQLVVSHDTDLVKETTGSGLISNTSLSAIQSLPLRDRKGNPNPSLHMLSFHEALALLQSYSSGGRGPVVIADLKDQTPWPAYLAGVSQVETTLNSSTQPAVVFKMKMNKLPTIDQVQTEAGKHPLYGHILPVVNPEDATGSPTGFDGPDWDPSVGSGNWSPSSSNFQTLLSLSNSSSSFVQQFELNINAVGDGASQYTNLLSSFATYWEPRFYPEGVSTINVSGPQPITICCYLPSPISKDLRGVLDFSLYYNTVAQPGVSLITSDNLAETLNFLSSLNLRNVSEIE